MDVFSIPYRYLSSSLGWRLCRPVFRDVKTFCLFIGYPRSGHTLVSSLLDAHPNMVVANELDALKYHKHGFSKEQMFYLLLRNSGAVAKEERIQTGYSYQVPNQWQGRFDKLQVIGDKKAGRAVLRFRKDPTLLRSLQKKLAPVPVKFIHCIRNPYDNISTMNMKRTKPLQGTIDFFFSLCETVEHIRKRVEETMIHDVRHEDLIANPKTVLTDLCRFLGIDVAGNYCDDCASIVYRSPHKSRLELPWSQQDIDRVKHRMRGFSFMDGYSYED